MNDNLLRHSIDKSKKLTTFFNENEGVGLVNEGVAVNYGSPHTLYNNFSTNDPDWIRLKEVFKDIQKAVKSGYLK